MFKKRKNVIPEHLKDTVIPEHLKETVAEKKPHEKTTILVKHNNVDPQYLGETVGNEKKIDSNKNEDVIDELFEIIGALREELKFVRKEIVEIKKHINKDVDFTK